MSFYGDKDHGKTVKSEPITVLQDKNVCENVSLLEEETVYFNFTSVAKKACVSIFNNIRESIAIR